MKTELLVCLLVAILQVEAMFVFHFTSEQEECIKELNLDEDTVRSLYIPVITVENSTVLNDFTRCDWLKRGFQNEDGVFDYERLSYSYDIVLKTFDDQPTIGEGEGHSVSELRCDAVNFCANYPPAQGENHGENAVKVQNCMAKFYLYLKEKYDKRLHHFCRA